jgi:hypothetical protein
MAPTKSSKERGHKEAKAADPRPSVARRAIDRIKRDNENGARQAMIEDLFLIFIDHSGRSIG